MPGVVVFYLVTLLFLRRRVGFAIQPTCETWQFTCSNGMCVAPNRFCDGNDDCGDSSDEPKACTNCNRTLMGESGVKYPVRLTEPPPLQRHLPFSCILNVAAAPDQRVEISFLSFHIGTLQVPNHKESSDLTRPICRNGYLHLSESGIGGTQEDRFRSQQTRGFSQLISALKEPDSRKRLSTLFEDASGNSKASDPQFGYFCGRLFPSAAGVSFYSTRSNVTVAVHLPPRTSVGPSQLFGIYLTYRFLPEESLSPVLESQNKEMPVYFGKPVPKTYCDKNFVDCDRKHCLIRSPNFPGLFLRNFTCVYTIRQERVPDDKLARIEIFQTNEYKIQVGGSTTATPSMSVGQPDRSAGLTADCDHDDVVEIFDKKRLISAFCGSGSLLSVFSSGPELVVVLKSRSEGNLYPSKLELELRVHYYNVKEIQNELHVDDNNHCRLYINGSVTKSGKIRNPQHTIPRGTVCEIRFVGSRSTDRIWIYFLSYFVQHRSSSMDLIRTADRVPDACDVSSLDLYLDHSVLNLTDIPSYRFCERTTPVMCTRASDYLNGIPEKPCLPPTESYLSSSNQATIKYSYIGSPEVASSNSASLFVVSYEFVDVDREPPLNSLFLEEEIRCGNHFSNVIANRRVEATFSSPSNVFLYGRGGAATLECRYEFHILPSQKLQIEIVNFRTNNRGCETRFDSIQRRWICDFSKALTNRKSYITITESLHATPNILVGCVCNKIPIMLTNISSTKSQKGSGFVFESTKTFRGLTPKLTESTFHFTYIVEGMTAFEDSKDFGFTANFLYLPSESTTNSDSRNCLAKSVRNLNTSGEVSIAASANRCLLCLTSRGGLKIRVSGTKCDRSMSVPNSKSRVLIYGVQNDATMPERNIWVPRTVICIPSSKDRSSPFEFFGVRWPKKAINDFTTSAYGVDKVTNNVSDDYNLYGHDVMVIEMLSALSHEVTIEWHLSQSDASSDSGGYEASRRLGEVDNDDDASKTTNCAFRCPELNACINPELLCDGIIHCPNTAFDEAAENCNGHPITVYVAIASGIALFLAIVIIVIALFATGRCKFFSRTRNETEFAEDVEPYPIPRGEVKQGTSKKQKQVKLYPRQIQAVEVRYPIIHM